MKQQNQKLTHVKHEFDPIFDENSEILILGTLPSVKSREQNFYYGHPQNRFWKVIAALFCEPVPERIPEKKDLLLKHHIALWDVIAECDIAGSSDSSIKNVVPAELSVILDHAPIRTIYANGAKAYDLYQKYTYPVTGRDIRKLPSTSPANAAFQMERLLGGVAGDFGKTSDINGDIIMHIDREDMLELTRRMTIARNCFNRVAGAYMDEEGFIDGSFNTHFLKLSPADKEKQLAIAKTIPYAKTNEQLKNFRIDSRQKKPGSIWHLLTALRDCELKNDALLYSLYEYIGERYVVDKPYTIEVFCGNYDVPVKGADKESQWESEEVYRFLVVAVCPTVGEYEAGTPEAGFLFPAFSNRSTDLDGVNIFAADENCEKLANMLGL